MLLLTLLVGCSEYRAIKQKPTEAVDPPGENFDPFGDAPDWEGCPAGFFGRYYNIPRSHSDIEPLYEPYPQDDPAELDWWDDEYLAFERFDPSLDFGQNWWPIDEGFDGDPSYFAVRWTAWIRVFESTDIEFVIGAADDFWLYIDDEPVFIQAGIHEFDSTTIPVPLGDGQFKLEALYAHRSGENGLRFRLLSEEAVICYPDFETEQ